VAHTANATTSCVALYCVGTGTGYRQYCAAAKLPVLYCSKKMSYRSLRAVLRAAMRYVVVYCAGTVPGYPYAGTCIVCVATVLAIGACQIHT
jgi:hypothetical protein